MLHPSAFVDGAVCSVVPPTHPHRYSATQKIEADAKALWGKEEVFVVKSSLYVEMRESNKNAPYTFKEVSHTHTS